MWKIEKTTSGKNDISILQGMYNKYGEWKSDNNKLIGELNDEEFLIYLETFGHLTHEKMKHFNDRITFKGKKPKVTQIRKSIVINDDEHYEI